MTPLFRVTAQIDTPQNPLGKKYEPQEHGSNFFARDPDLPSYTLAMINIIFKKY